MSATTIWGVQDGLLTKLNASTPLTDVAKCLGWPTGGPAREQIFISGNVERTQQAPHLTTSANATRHELLTMSVVVFVKWETDDYTEVRNRAKTLADAVEVAVQGDSSLGGVAFYAQIVSHDVEEGIEDDARLVVVTLRVGVSAYFAG